MAKYMLTASYSSEGIKGLLADGGTSRVAVVEELAKGVGGTIESIYFSFGGNDIMIIADIPDNASAAAIALTVGSTGALASFNTTVLLTPAEMDAAAQKSPAYRAPGA